MSCKQVYEKYQHALGECKKKKKLYQLIQDVREKHGRKKACNLDLCALYPQCKRELKGCRGYEDVIKKYVGGVGELTYIDFFKHIFIEGPDNTIAYINNKKFSLAEGTPTVEIVHTQIKYLSPNKYSLYILLTLDGYYYHKDNKYRHEENIFSQLLKKVASENNIITEEKIHDNYHFQYKITNTSVLMPYKFFDKIEIEFYYSSKPNVIKFKEQYSKNEHSSLFHICYLRHSPYFDSTNLYLLYVFYECVKELQAKELSGCMVSNIGPVPILNSKYLIDTIYGYDRNKSYMNTTIPEKLFSHIVLSNITRLTGNYISISRSYLTNAYDISLKLRDDEYARFNAQLPVILLTEPKNIKIDVDEIYTNCTSWKEYTSTSKFCSYLTFSIVNTLSLEECMHYYSFIAVDKEYQTILCNANFILLDNKIYKAFDMVFLDVSEFQTVYNIYLKEFNLLGFIDTKNNLILNCKYIYVNISDGVNISDLSSLIFPREINGYDFIRPEDIGFKGKRSWFTSNCKPSQGCEYIQPNILPTVKKTFGMSAMSKQRVYPPAQPLPRQYYDSVHQQRLGQVRSDNTVAATAQWVTRQQPSMETTTQRSSVMRRQLPMGSTTQQPSGTGQEKLSYGMLLKLPNANEKKGPGNKSVHLLPNRGWVK